MSSQYLSDKQLSPDLGSALDGQPQSHWWAMPNPQDFHCCPLRLGFLGWAWTQKRGDILCRLKCLWLTFFILSYEFAWMLYSQASNAYHSKIRLCTSYTGMYVSMKVKVVLSYQLVQLTLREDAQPQGWARPSDLDLGTCRRRSTCKKHLPEPQDLPRGWFCVPDYLLRTGGQVGLKQLKPHWYISFLSNSQWSPPSLT